MSFNESLKLLSDESRMSIIQTLRKGEICVCDLAEQLGLEQTLISHHLNKLKAGDLVKVRKSGRWVHYSLNIKTFEKLEKQYIKMYGSSNITEERCNIHPECCLDTKCND